MHNKRQGSTKVFHAAVTTKEQMFINHFQTIMIKCNNSLFYFCVPLIKYFQTVRTVSICQTACYTHSRCFFFLSLLQELHRYVDGLKYFCHHHDYDGLVILLSISDTVHHPRQQVVVYSNNTDILNQVNQL